MSERNPVEEAREIVRRLGEKHALVLLLERRINEMNTRLVNVRADIEKSNVHAAQAMEVIEREHSRSAE